MESVDEFTPAALRRLPMRELLRVAADHPGNTYEGFAAAAELKRREGRPARLALILSVVSLLVGALFSAVSLTFAARQFRLASQMPYKAALYSAKVQAMRDYARAYHQFDTKLHEGLIDLPYDVDPDTLNHESDEHMVESAKAARPVISAESDYVREVAASLGVWPDWLDDQMQKVDDVAQVADKCWATLGAHSRLPHVEWGDVRRRASEACTGIYGDHEKIVAFELASEGVLKAMRANLTQTDTELLPKES